MDKWKKWNRIIDDVFCILAILITPSFIINYLWYK